MSAIVPPTIAAAVEPKAPPRKRPMMTVCMFCALSWNISEHGQREDGTYSSQCDHQVHQHRPNTADDVDRLPPELFAKGGGPQRDEREG